MNCETFEERAHQLLDRRERLGADEQLAAHAATCDRCWASWQTYQRLVSAYPTRPLGVADGKSFSSRVIEQWQLELANQAAAEESPPISETENPKVVPKGRSRGMFRQRMAIASVVAGLVLVVTVLVGMQGGSVERSGSTALHSDAHLQPRPGQSEGATESESNSIPSWEFGLSLSDIDYGSLTMLGGESLSVVEPLAKPLNLAYDLLKQSLWSVRGDRGNIQFDERWRLILDNVA